MSLLTYCILFSDSCGGSGLNIIRIAKILILRMSLEGLMLWAEADGGDGDEVGPQ